MAEPDQLTSASDPNERPAQTGAPSDGSIRLDRSTVDALAHYRSTHGLLSQDEAIMSLLARSSEDVQ